MVHSLLCNPLNACKHDECKNDRRAPSNLDSRIGGICRSDLDCAFAHRILRHFWRCCVRLCSWPYTVICRHRRWICCRIWMGVVGIVFSTGWREGIRANASILCFEILLGRRCNGWCCDAQRTDDLPEVHAALIDEMRAEPGHREDVALCEKCTVLGFQELSNRRSSPGYGFVSIEGDHREAPFRSRSARQLAPFSYGGRFDRNHLQSWASYSTPGLRISGCKPAHLAYPILYNRTR